MNIEKHFEKPLSTFFDGKTKKGDIGIEIECEGSVISGLPESTTYWKAVPEGSLRNGIEYVLKNPVNVERLDDALLEWGKLTYLNKFEPSIRTSVHIHINVSGLNYSEYIRALGVYWLVENLLVGLNGTVREGNLFCLRAKDANNSVSYVLDALANLQMINPHPESFKYSALNLVALAKYRSMEFRFIRGTVSTKIMKFWAENLFSFVHKTRDTRDLGKVLESIDFSDVRPFLRQALTPALYSAVTKRYEPHELNTLVCENYNYVSKLDAILKKELPTRRPFVNREHEDLDDKPIGALHQINMESF